MSVIQIFYFVSHLYIACVTLCFICITIVLYLYHILKNIATGDLNPLKNGNYSYNSSFYTV